ncbi:MAG: hypothetical protein NDJ90_04230 [Oligoflexia bacterium]|nr:hypothetical protein [Oligoflexia bacterium]
MASGAEKNQLLPFTTDGCSMSLDNGPITQRDWVHCCIEHDKAYWLGGTVLEKDAADLALKKCLLRARMTEFESGVYYKAVQSGGSPSLPTTWKWGYGWVNARGYSPITVEERREAKQYERLFSLPFRIVVPAQQVAAALIRNDFCKEDLLNRISKKSGIKSVKDFYVVKVETADGRDAFQVFSPECKGGYFYSEFLPRLAPDLCFRSTYRSSPDQVKVLQAFGDCTFKSSVAAEPRDRRHSLLDVKPDTESLSSTPAESAASAPAAAKAE